MNEAITLEEFFVKQWADTSTKFDKQDMIDFAKDYLDHLIEERDIVTIEEHDSVGDDEGR